MKSRYRPNQYELPDESHHHGEIASVEYRPNVKTNFGIKNKVRFWIDTDQVGTDGEPIRVFLSFNDTLHPSGDLYPFIVKMTGEAPQPGYDFDDLLGIPVEYDIEHSTGNDGRTWPNVNNIRRERTAKEVADDKHSEERVKKAIADIKNQQQPEPGPKKKGNGAKSQWEAKKKTTPNPPAEKCGSDDGPLFPEEPPVEINDEDIPF
jgi:hypothetical protein